MAHVIGRAALIVAITPVLLISAQALTTYQIGVTPVQGESLLLHLQRAFDQTSMGKTWTLGPPAPAPGQKSAKCEPKRTVTLQGSDLYRLNCQGCHGESGAGAPPEINSVINPIRATSAPAIMARMKKIGVDMTPRDANVLATQANAAVLDRLHKGGEDMPAFPHLSDQEIQTLIPYLKKLAGVAVPDREQALVIQASSLHVGEQIVKSTCHTCHSAVGPNPTPQQILDGKIPPLGTLTTRVSLPEFVRKVTEGAPVIMGTPALPCRGRMSVFYYLTKDEAASAYLYLSVYPPHS